MNPFDDTYFMKKALQEAETAFDKSEVPVGAVIVLKDQIIARAHNLTETLNDVTAHAEMQVFTAAADFLGGKYLKECTMYVTLEPCQMCAGASYWAQLGKIVYGAAEPDRGSPVSPNQPHCNGHCLRPARTEHARSAAERDLDRLRPAVAELP